MSAFTKDPQSSSSNHIGWIPPRHDNKYNHTVQSHSLESDNPEDFDPNNILQLDSDELHFIKTVLARKTPAPVRLPPRPPQNMMSKFAKKATFSFPVKKQGVRSTPFFVRTGVGNKKKRCLFPPQRNKKTPALPLQFLLI